MSTFEFTNKYGDTYTLRFIKTSYVCDGSLAIAVEYEDPSSGCVPYGVLTVNIGEFVFGPKIAYLDTNNMQSICDLVLERGWAKVIGEGRSGYCTYPLVEFTDEFIDGICEEEE